MIVRFLQKRLAYARACEEQRREEYQSRSKAYWALYHRLKEENLPHVQGFPEFQAWRQFVEHDLQMLRVRHSAAMRRFWRAQRRVARLNRILTLLGKDSFFCTVRVTERASSATVTIDETRGCHMGTTMTYTEWFWTLFNEARANCAVRHLQERHARLTTELAELDKSPLAQARMQNVTAYRDRIADRISVAEDEMERLGYRVPRDAHPSRSPFLAPRRMPARRVSSG